MSSYEYNQLLKFLYFEGYADSYEEAECILEDMSDEEFEDLCEKKLAHSFPLKPSEKRSVKNIGRMNRGDFSVSPGERPPTETRTKSASKSTTKRKTDLSKVIIAQYLYGEGYTETIESAELMAENISETWANEILDEKYVEKMDTTGRGPDHRTRFPKFKGKDNEFDPKFTQQRVKSNTKKIDPYFSGRKERKDEKRQGTGGFGA